MKPDQDELRLLFIDGRAGDKHDQHVFLTHAAELLRSYFRRHLHTRPHDVEDLVQITLMSLHAKRDSYDAKQPLMPWIYAIARYRLYDFLRQMKRRPSASLENIDIVVSEDPYEASDARRDVSTLLSALPEKQRKAIRMVKLEHRGVREVAAATGWSESDVKVSVHRGLKALMRMAAQHAA